VSRPRVALLLLLLLLLLATGCAPSSPATPSPAPAPAAQAPASATADPCRGRYRLPPPPRDPFALAFARERWSGLDLRLEGVVAGEGGGARALVSGRTYRPGDRLDTFQVAAVDSRSVVLRDPGGALLRLPLGGAQ